ncbi:hypothetical protein HB364_13960 [Pseudoflavitalea sp. X16]|uniref:hypothetical protein n=1 Tax=Paraflavitalea devenefica TaxID=2716334 RepID=UPI00141DA1FE|nr:hypothetical protein [Paraflavitalea devenefica]NII26194.1 hypothetical protein [Paraflavitalea devenefica]
MCKTCIFGSTPIHLSAERMAEIRNYLANFSSSHICHTTNKTCYGALQFQAQILHAMGIIPDRSVASLLETASHYLGTASPGHGEKSVPQPGPSGKKPRRRSPPGKDGRRRL